MDNLPHPVTTTEIYLARIVQQNDEIIAPLTEGARPNHRRLKEPNRDVSLTTPEPFWGRCGSSAPTATLTTRFSATRRSRPFSSPNEAGAAAAASGTRPDRRVAGAHPEVHRGQRAENETGRRSPTLHQQAEAGEQRRAADDDYRDHPRARARSSHPTHGGDLMQGIVDPRLMGALGAISRPLHLSSILTEDRGRRRAGGQEPGNGPGHADVPCNIMPLKGPRSKGRTRPTSSRPRRSPCRGTTPISSRATGRPSTARPTTSCSSSRSSAA